MFNQKLFNFFLIIFHYIVAYFDDWIDHKVNEGPLKLLTKKILAFCLDLFGIWIEVVFSPKLFEHYFNW